MLSVSSLNVPPPPQTQDEDIIAEKRPKLRHPKSREKWSSLWFIPPSVLNDREVSFNGKKGKRHGFDRYNYLSCKDCRESFRSSESLSMHRMEVHQGTNDTPRYTPSPSFKPRSSQSFISGSLRRSSRRRSHNSRKIYYGDDDDIEILDGPSNSHLPRARSSKKRTSVIEEVCIDDDDSITELSIEELYTSDDSIQEVTMPMEEGWTNDDSIQEVTIEEGCANDDSSVEEVSIEPDITPILDTLKTVQITPLTIQEGEEVLLMDDTPEDDDDISIEVVLETESNKRKQSPSGLLTRKNKKSKDDVPVDKNMEDDMIEIQSSSGKRMLVKKSKLRTLGI